MPDVHHSVQGNSIPFVQYSLPHGRKSMSYFTCDEADVLERAQEFLKAGFVFEVEVLRTGHVSMTISDDHGDYAIEISENDEAAIRGTVTRMLMTHNLSDVLRQSAAAREMQ